MSGFVMSLYIVIGVTDNGKQIPNIILGNTAPNPTWDLLDSNSDLEGWWRYLQDYGFHKVEQKESSGILDTNKIYIDPVL